GAHHLSLGSGADRQVRAAAAGPGCEELRLRCRFPSGELSAPPGPRLHRPVRCQCLSLHHPRDGLFRPRRGARRQACRGLRRRHGTLLPDQLRYRLALSDRRIARDRARAQRGGGARQLRGAERALRPRQLPARRARARPGGEGLPRMTALPEGYELTEEIDLAAAHAYLARSYWSPNIPFEIVERAIANSLSIAVRHGGEQVGLARVVTDRATFAYLADVYVLEEHRGKGLAQALVQWLHDHPE